LKDGGELRRAFKIEAFVSSFDLRDEVGRDVERFSDVALTKSELNSAVAKDLCDESSEGIIAGHEWPPSARVNFASVQDHHHGAGRLIQTVLLLSAVDNISLSEVSGFKEIAQPWYSDQILPFDITLCGTNEVGAATTMKIFGVEILNEGSGVSIDDAVTEMQATFVARYVEPWQAVRGKDFGIGVGGDSLGAGLRNAKWCSFSLQT
jgi:hypothetical protein